MFNDSFTLFMHKLFCFAPFCFPFSIFMHFMPTVIARFVAIFYSDFFRPQACFAPLEKLALFEKVFSL